MTTAHLSHPEDGARKLRRWTLWALLAALAVAAVLRFAVLEQKPLWCDELATLQRLELPFTQHVRSMQGNHPLYEILLRFWMPLDGSDRWMRLPSAALGVLAVWLTWLLMRSVGRKEALLAAWLMALSPLHIMYSRIARAYSLACALALLSNLSLLWAVKRRGAWPLFAYVLTTALMIYCNLLAGSIWVAQALFLLWFYRRRLRRLVRWIGANLAVGLLILPWMIFSLQSAVIWSQETTYTAQQLGKLYKVAHVAMTLCVGETVHPLNFRVVPLALIGFGAAMILGIRYAVKRRSSIGAFLLVQAVVGLGLALYFAAASPKHVTTLLPAWLGLTAIGIVKARHPKTPALCACLIAISMALANFNYFTNREFTDADMVTPWRKMSAVIQLAEKTNEALVVGYRMDRGACDMFRRYYTGALKPEYLDFPNWQQCLSDKLRSNKSVWLLLHDGDPWEDIEAWMKARGRRFEMMPFQEEEHTLKGLREWRAARNAHPSFFAWLRAMPRYASRYRSPLYRLYLIRDNTPS